MDVTFADKRDEPIIHEISDRRPHEVKLYYKEHLKEYLPQHLPKPEFSEEAKLLDENILLCKNIIVRLDKLDEDRRLKTNNQ